MGLVLTVKFEKHVATAAFLLDLVAGFGGQSGDSVPSILVFMGQ